MKEVHSSRGTVMLEAVLVADQGAGHGADFEELMPVGVVAGQPRALQGQHDPDLAHADLGGQLREPGPAGRRGTGDAQVLVDHRHRGAGPAQLAGPGDQVVLAGGRLTVCLLYTS